jgi:hypothetical protein
MPLDAPVTKATVPSNPSGEGVEVVISILPSCD